MWKISINQTVKSNLDVWYFVRLYLISNFISKDQNSPYPVNNTLNENKIKFENG